MRDKYGVAEDKYCYPGTDVLINLLDIKDADLLAEAEVAFTAERYKTYTSNCTDINHFTFAHFKELHHHLFQDLYDWAGKVRDVDISKGGTRFCTFTRIEPEAEKLFSQLPKLESFSERDDFLDGVADSFCEINLLHPFREGNGRVQRFFFEEMLFVLGYDVTWPKISREQWLDANIAGVNLNLAPLKDIFDQALNAR